jgi:hypothetical protein
VFVPAQVIEEAQEQSRSAGSVETGGVLVGHLHRDVGGSELFVEVTAQIPAPHTEANAVKLTFTADTWVAVRAALALRKRNEVWLAWWHFHPAPCVMNDCPPEKRAQCPATSAFFSADDIALHTALFSRAFNTALLISATGGGALSVALYGWRQGMVVPRGFHVLTTTANQYERPRRRRVPGHAAEAEGR